MAKSIQISRVMSANVIQHSTKILAVNCKQLSNDSIDPLFLWYLWVSSVKAEPQWAKYPNFSHRHLMRSEKPILEFLSVVKQAKPCTVASYLHHLFACTLMTHWARAYPQDVLTPCCHHTCQRRREGDKSQRNNYQISLCSRVYY
jgi:hypothetical protein